MSNKGRTPGPVVDFQIDVDAIEEAPEPLEAPNSQRPHPSTLSMLPLVEKCMDRPGHWFRAPIPKQVQGSMSSRVATLVRYLNLGRGVLEYRTRSEFDRFGRQVTYLYLKVNEIDE